MSPAIWLSLARDDLRAAELLQQHGIAPLSRMHADQAVEKALWALQLHREGQGDKVKADASPVFGPGAQRGRLAAALASLSLQARHRQLTGDDSEAELAREAVQVAHQVIDRITERVYG